MLVSTQLRRHDSCSLVNACEELISPSEVPGGDHAEHAPATDQPGGPHQWR
jgi:hypothetical protein